MIRLVRHDWNRWTSKSTMDHRYMVARRLDEASIRKTMRWFYLEAVRRGFDTRLFQPVEVPLSADPPWWSGWNVSLMHGKGYEVCVMLENLLGVDKFHDMVRTILKEKKGGVAQRQGVYRVLTESEGRAAGSVCCRLDRWQPQKWHPPVQFRSGKNEAATHAIDVICYAIARGTPRA